MGLILLARAYSFEASCHSLVKVAGLSLPVACMNIRVVGNGIERRTGRIDMSTCYAVVVVFFFFFLWACILTFCPCFGMSWTLSTFFLSDGLQLYSSEHFTHTLCAWDFDILRKSEINVPLERIQRKRAPLTPTTAEAPATTLMAWPGPVRGVRAP